MPVPYPPVRQRRRVRADQVCDTAVGAGAVRFPPDSLFGVCTTTCTSAAQCAGPSGQRACGAAGRCYLQCDNFDLINPNRWCPLGMECIDYACTWRR